MPEQYHPVQQDPKEDFRGQAIEAAQGVEWDEMLAERNQEVQQQAEQQAYDSTRPYKDIADRVRDPETGAIIKPDQYYDKKREEHYNSTTKPYAEMGVLEIARELAKAEIDQNNRTLVEDLSDALLDRLAVLSEKTSKVVEDGIQKDNPNPSNPQDALWNRVIGYKEKYKEQALKDNSTGEKSSEYETEELQSVVSEQPQNQEAQSPEDESIENDKSFRAEFGSAPRKFSPKTEVPGNGARAEIKPSTGKGKLNTEIFTDTQNETLVNEIAPSDAEAQDSPKGVKGWLKYLWNKEGAVTFNKTENGKRIGDATVDTDPERVVSGKRLAATVVGLGSLAAIGYGITHAIVHKDLGPISDALNLGKDNAAEPANNGSVHPGLMDEIPDASSGDNSGGTGNGESPDSSQEIYIDTGSGYTQELKELFPNHSAEEYKMAHDEALKKFGAEYISGVDKFKMTDDSLGFSSTGKVVIPAEVMDFLKVRLG